FKGMSRIAKSSPQMWESIFLQNKDNLLSSIDFFQQELERCKQMIQLDKNDELREWMKQANTLREIL
ncbi:prephenate dehydrogenase/arogenate dehydrogenase family protein, partial [Campylobacter jejuni]|nr:prephenate dehydrogenase/arogenate dehydrogenase family protein [Campylobacter jejuni]